MCDEIIEETKNIQINFNEKNITCKIQNFSYLLKRGTTWNDLKRPETT